MALCARIVATTLAVGSAFAQTSLPSGGSSVLSIDALLTTSVGGLERTNSTAQIVPVTGMPFAKALQVTVRTRSAETNETQLTMTNAVPVGAGDTLLASFWVRGSASGGLKPANIEFLFERRVDPWTKSTTFPVATAKDSGKWRRVLVPFAAAESYRPGEAMASLRFAFGPQTIEVGGLTVTDYGKGRSVDDLVQLSADLDSVDGARLTVDIRNPKQTLVGLGGDFCQPRYGATEPMDVVGNYVLSHLHVAHARVGLPLEKWAPEPGVFRDDAQARASFLALQELKRRGIPTVVSVWEGPEWLLGGRPEQRRVLPPEKYGACIDAIARYLETARDKYGVSVPYFSFNEANYGVNFYFTAQTMADFIRQAGPELARRNLATKFLVGDTGNGASFYDYAKPQLEDPTIAAFLGPLSFHCWDALGAPEESYRKIAELGRRYRKPVWCLEAGHDAGLWQARDPWGTWENALRTALAYQRTLSLTDAVVMDYWTYQDNYPLVDKNGPRAYPVFEVMRQMETVFRPGVRVVAVESTSDELRAIGTVGPGGALALMMVNPAGGGKVTVGGLPAGTSVVPYVSDRSAQMSKGKPLKVGPAGRVTLEVPSRSVVTLVRG